MVLELEALLQVEDDGMKMVLVVSGESSSDPLMNHLAKTGFVACLDHQPLIHVHVVVEVDVV